MSTHKISAEDRNITGRKVSRLRREGLLPANVFGKGIKSRSIQVRADEFSKIFEETGETGVIQLTVGKTTEPVLVSNVQTHPVTGDLLHIDFRQIDLTQKTTATVPVELVGESPAEKTGKGTVVHQLMELEVEALPTDLPENFEIDISKLLEVDEAIFVKDIKHDKQKVEILTDPELIVVKVEPPQEEKEVVVPEAEEGEAADATGKAKEDGNEGGDEKDSGETSKEEK